MMSDALLWFEMKQNRKQWVIFFSEQMRYGHNKIQQTKKNREVSIMKTKKTKTKKTQTIDTIDIFSSNLLCVCLVVFTKNQ